MTQFQINEINDTFCNLLGFSQLFNELERWTETEKPTQKYPPYNVIQQSDLILTLEIAVAGFSKNEITIELDKDILTVDGTHGETKDKKYLHRGLSNRPFSLSFKLAGDVTVNEVMFEDGLLHIEIHKTPPEISKPLKIEISIPK